MSDTNSGSCHLPRTIKQTRSKLDLPVILSALTTLSALWVCGYGNPKHFLSGIIATIVFGVFTIANIAYFIFPARLTVTADGFVQHGPLGTKARSWNEAANFRVVRLRRGAKLLAFDDLRPPDVQRISRTINRAFGAEGWLLQHWSLSLEEVAALLNKARAEWQAAGQAQKRK
ncbi:MAG TPA: hypothetical protein VNZ61_02945 [Roseomonas sp.]|nr:hypothetical protein [Roseomonas sp.]